MSEERQKFEELPRGVREYIGELVRRVRYRRRVRREVGRELTDHFVEALGDCESEQERNELGEKLVAEFGEAKVLAKLIRRGKKRCRPLWLKAMIRTCQVMGIFLLVVGLRAVHLSVGEPNVNVDYVKWLNEKVRSGHDESLNAKPYYDKAVELSRKELPEFLRGCKKNCDAYWPGQMSESQRQTAKRFINENSEAITVLREGAAMPYCWTEYSADPEPMKAGVFVLNALPEIGGYRNLAKGLALQIGWRAYRRDVEGALNDCVVLQRFGGHMQGKGSLIEQLVGVSIERLGHRMTLMVLDRADVPAEALREIAADLGKEYEKQRAAICFEMEKAIWYNFVQCTFTDDGKGGGRMLIRGMPVAVGSWKDMLRGFILGYPDRHEVIAMIEGYFDLIEEDFEKSPWELRNDSRAAEAREKIKEKSILLSLVVPALRRTGKHVWQVKADRTGLLTVLALLQHEKEKGEYPVKLEELVQGGYLRQLAADPYSEGKLRYERRGGEFILYSVGADFVDNGGKQVPEDLWGERETGGDRVFWPVEF